MNVIEWYKFFHIFARCLLCLICCDRYPDDMQIIDKENVDSSPAYSLSDPHISILVLTINFLQVNWVSTVFCATCFSILFHNTVLYLWELCIYLTIIQFQREKRFIFRIELNMNMYKVNLGLKNFKFSFELASLPQNHWLFQH